MAKKKEEKSKKTRRNMKGNNIIHTLFIPAIFLRPLFFFFSFCSASILLLLFVDIDFGILFICNFKTTCRSFSFQFLRPFVVVAGGCIGSGYKNSITLIYLCVGYTVMS